MNPTVQIVLIAAGVDRPSLPGDGRPNASIAITRESNRGHDRSRSRDGPSRQRGQSAERPWANARPKHSGSQDELPYLPPAEYKKFKSEVTKAKEDVYRKFFKSSPPSKSKEHVRAATSHHLSPDDNLSDSEIRALRASVSGWSEEESDGDSDESDPSPDA